MKKIINESEFKNFDQKQALSILRKGCSSTTLEVIKELDAFVGRWLAGETLESLSNNSSWKPFPKAKIFDCPVEIFVANYNCFNKYKIS